MGRPRRRRARTPHVKKRSKGTAARDLAHGPDTPPRHLERHRVRPAGAGLRGRGHGHRPPAGALTHRHDAPRPRGKGLAHRPEHRRQGHVPARKAGGHRRRGRTTPLGRGIPPAGDRLLLPRRPLHPGHRRNSRAPTPAHLAQPQRPSAVAIPPKRWLTVPQALELPIPDTPWIKDPVQRDTFTSWLYA